MKTVLVFFICFSFSFSEINAQDVRIDYNLAEQFAENYAVRIASEKAFKEVLESQQKDYRRILIKSSAINEIKKKLHKAIYEVSDEIKSGKKVKYFLKVLDEIKHNSDEMLVLANKESKYSEHFTKLYNNIMETRENIYRDTEPVFSTTIGMHMDNYDRIELITKMTQKAEAINEEILQLKSFLEISKMVDNTKNGSPFKNYVNNDKEIMEVVMKEYKDKF